MHQFAVDRDGLAGFLVCLGFFQFDSQFLQPSLETGDFLLERLNRLALVRTSLSRLGRARCRQRHVVARIIGGAGARIGDAAADGQDARCIRDRLLAQPIREFAEVGAGASTAATPW